MFFVVASAVGFGALAATPPLEVVAAAALAGLIAGPINPLYETVVQERTPLQMLGRTFGTLAALAYVGVPIGSVLAGVYVEEVGLVPTIVGMGAIYLVVTLGIGGSRVRHDDDHYLTTKTTQRKSAPGAR